jgi:acyl transferase domain-containing protein/acyl carrier protein
LLVSARSEVALQAQAQRLGARLRECPGLAPLDVAFSLAGGRAQLERRAVVVGGDRERLLAGLGALGCGGSAEGLVRGVAGGGGKLAFLFSGQGSQWAGMGEGLYRVFPCFAGSLDGVCVELDRYLERSLKEVLFSVEGSEGALLLDRTEFTQPAIFALGVALFELVGSFGVLPDYLIGHSIGELCAAYVAGVLSLEDACALVAARGRLMGELAQTGAMAAVQLSEAEAIESLAGFEGLGLAAVNGPSSVVVSGEREALGRWEDSVKEGGVKVRRLRVSHAFHSSLMEPMLAGLREVAEGLSFSEPKLPIVSNVSGGLLSGEQATSPEYWARHVRETVRFSDGVRSLEQAGVTRFVELGPDGILSALTAQCLSVEAEQGALIAASMRARRPQVESFIGCLADAHVHGVQVDWGRLFVGRGARRVGLPTYAFQRRRYWLESGAGAGDASALGQSPAGHPLLGAAVELAGDREGLLFTGRLSLGGHAWLGDHAVLGSVLLPGAGFLELALAAAERVGAREIEELTLQAPLLLSEQGAYQVQLVLTEPDEAGRRLIEIYSRAETSRDELEVSEWTLHASGVLAGQRGSLPGVLEGFAGEGWPPSGAERLNVDGFYERCAEAGYEYGPSFQGLKQAWRSGQELFVEVALPEEQKGQAHGFCVHPALLDAALHGLVLGALDGEGEGVRVPFSFSGVRLYARGASELRVQLSAQQTAEEGAPGLVAVDSAGDPVLSVERIQARPIDPRLLASARLAGSDSLFTVEWTELPTPPSDGQPQGDGQPQRLALLGEVEVEGIEAERYADLRALDEALAKGAPVPDVVLAAAPAASDADRVPQAARAVVGGVLELLQAWLAREQLAEARLVVVTRGAVAVADGDVPDLAVAPVWGLVRSAQSEHPERLLLVDLDPGSERAAAGGLAGLSWAKLSALEEPQLAVREGRILVPRLARTPGSVDGSGTPFDSEGTVLIVGGTGGLGVLFARHLAGAHGVRRLVLTSRRGMEAEGAGELVDELAELGCEARVVACDVSDRAQCASLIEGIGETHPLQGVIHAAGVLEDGLVASMGTEQVERVMRPKVDGAFHLHELTAGMELAEFVVFSSAAGVMGSPGQANYAAGNAFLDALAHHRRAQGLAGRSLAWGLWAQKSGMSGTLDEAGLARLGRIGVLALENEQGLQLFDDALLLDRALLVPMRADAAGLRAQARAGMLPALLRGLVRMPARRENEASLARRLAGVPEEEWDAIVLEIVRGQVASVLGHTSAREIEPQAAFTDLGFESLGAVELRNRLKAITGLRLPATLVFDYPTPAQVATHILERAARTGVRPESLVDIDIDQLQTRLATLGPEEAERKRVAARLQALLEELRAPVAADEVDVADRLQSASAEEVLAFIDSELETI